MEVQKDLIIFSKFINFIWIEFLPNYSLNQGHPVS